MGKGVRKAIEKGTISREDVFVTSKIMPGDYRRADEAIDDSLSSLGLDYADLMLVPSIFPRNLSYCFSTLCCYSNGFGSISAIGSGKPWVAFPTALQHECTEM